MASMEPRKNPGNVFPSNLTEIARNIASLKMAIMGPKITALGDMVFIMAQINPARQNKPFSFQM